VKGIELKYVPTLSNNSLKTSIKVSAVLHVLCGLLLFFGLPRIIPPLPAPRDPVSFEVVTIGEITNTRIKKDDELTKREPIKKIEPPPKPEPPKPVPEQPKPEPPKPEPPKPEPAKPEAVKEPEPAPEPKPAEKPRNLDDILGDIKKKPEEKPKPKTPDPLGGVLKNLAKLEEKNAAKSAQQEQDKQKLSLTDAMANAFANALSDKLTISEEDALRRQLFYCWNPPIGARDAHTLTVEIAMKVNPDRIVTEVEVVDKWRYSTDSFFRAAADAAIRAIRNPKCSPLALNPDKYEQWKNLIFNFNPRDML